MEIGDHDEARGQTDLPLTADEVWAFLTHSELVFRLNPHLEIQRWESLPDGFDLTLINELNGQRLETAAAVTALPNGWLFTYAAGLKQATTLRVEAAEPGSRLILSDQYPRIEDPQDPRVAEVDRSLVPWVAAIRRHLLARRRWGWLPGWRWWHERFLLGMPPRQRRLARLILWVSIAEFAIFLGLVIVLGLMP